MAGPCDWPLDITQCCDDMTGVTPELIEAAVSRASSMMSRLSGFTIGQCADSVRPLNVCKECRGWCCGGADGIRLMAKDARTITNVSRVRIGATTLAADTWRFDAPTQMLWRVPPDKWPKKDERWMDPGAGEAFVVDVTTGAEPDAWARSVGTLLACEFINSCLNRKCRLPKNTTQVTGQGITVTMSEQEIVALLPEVAGWVQVVNPHNAVLPARMMSPDLESYYTGGGCCGRYR